MVMVNIPFTGWESDKFVTFAKVLLEQGITPHVRIVGREPITTTSVNFEGVVTGAIWQGYIRALEVESLQHIVYQVGGSNSSRPIASETVLFLNVPIDIVGDISVSKDKEVVLSLLQNTEHLTASFLKSLAYSLRLGYFKEVAIRQKIASILNANLAYLDVEQQRIVAEIFALLSVPEVIPPLLVLFQSNNPSVRIEVALRFRYLETLIKSMGENSEKGKESINALMGALDDPNEQVRIYAAEDLGYFYNFQATEKLIYKLFNDPSEHVRWACVIALGRTNRKDSAQYLIKALLNDDSEFVQRGAMLGLGRIGQQAIMVGQQWWDEAIGRLCHILDAGPPSLQDYAAYTVGEMRNVHSKCIYSLVECLSPEKAFQIKSNATLSLTKLLESYYQNYNIRERIKSLLEQNLEKPRPTGWPSAAFYKWFLSAAAELSALLEFHDLSSAYYQHASTSFADVRWVSRYYKAISLYESAENKCEQGDIGAALANLQSALEEFNELESSEEIRALSGSDTTLSGLRFKSVLAKARFEMLKAIQRLAVPGLSEDDLEEVRESFMQSLRQYKHIDVIGLTEEGKRLSRMEVNLVLSLATLAELGRGIANLKLFLLQLAKERIELQLGNIFALIDNLVRLSKESRSYVLQSMATQLQESMQLCKEKMRSGAILTEIAGWFISEVTQIYSEPFPTPGVCPIVEFGKAEFVLKLPDSIAGDGTRENPYLFPADKNLVFEVDVTVHRRTKNDQLLFEVVEPPAGARGIMQEIPVHESIYSLRPIDLGKVAPSKVPQVFRFVLSFRNQGCSQPVQTQMIWVKIIDPLSEHSGEKQRIQQEIITLNNAIIDLQRQIERINMMEEDLRAKGDVLPLDMRSKRSRMETELTEKQKKRNNLLLKLR